MNYLAIKHFHMACAASSGCLFLLRGYWMMRNSILLQQRWIKIAPHLVDTLLLVSAATLAVWSQQYPFAQPWLTAKFIALVLYIILGTIALKRGKTMTIRITAFTAAVLVFIHIGSVAISKQAFPLT